MDSYPSADRRAKIVLGISTIRSADSVWRLCELAASEEGMTVFSEVVVVDSLGTIEMGQRFQTNEWRTRVRYYNSPTNLGSAGNLARRLKIAAGLGADYLYALNDDGVLALAIVEKLRAIAITSTVGAVYPLSRLSRDQFSLSGLSKFPVWPAHKQANDLPDVDRVRVSWSSSNGALYSLQPVRDGIYPPVGLWHGYEDLAYGLLLQRAGYVQVLDVTSRLDANYEVRQVCIGSRQMIVTDKPPWLSYYFARNLLLIATRYVPSVGHAVRALIRIAIESVAIVMFRSEKLTRLRLLASGALDGLRGREGLIVSPG